MSRLPAKKLRLRSSAVFLLLWFFIAGRGTAVAADRPLALDDVPALLRELDAGQADLSYEAARMLASLGPGAIARATPELNRLARYSIYAHTRVWAVELTEGHVPSWDADTIKWIVVIMRHPRQGSIDDVRAVMVRDFKSSVRKPEMPEPLVKAPATQPSDWDRDIPKWADSLRSWDGDTRFLAAQSLAASASHDLKGKAIDSLCAALGSDNNHFRIEVAEALRNYGPAAANAAPALCRMVDNADPELRVAAVRALLRINAPSSSLVSALIASIVQHDESCADALMTHVGSGAAPRLMLQLTELSRSDPDPRVRALAANAEDTFARLEPRNGH